MKKATIYNFSRLCRAQKNKCENCPMSADNNGADKLCLTLVTKYPDKANEIILKWCEEHPVETRQDRFLKIFPNARVDTNGILDVCPKIVNINNKCTAPVKKCGECCKKYWLAEVDENE